ncbi:MAG: hypothetical protein K2M36_01985 [Clostridia bacterium]|nr:hypothetical protein [Clostridia bacterium]
MLFKFRKMKKNKLSEKDIRWNKLWDMYADGSLESNYFALCDYHAGVNGEGHYCFFDNNVQRLADYVKSLNLLLPNEFFAQFNKAYEAYIQNIEAEKACDLADDYFYNNEQVIIDILQKYADSLADEII